MPAVLVWAASAWLMRMAVWVMQQVPQCGMCSGVACAAMQHVCFVLMPCFCANTLLRY